MAVTRACRATVARVVLPWLRSPCPKTRETPRNDARDRGTAPVAGAFVRSSKRVRAPPLGSSPSLHRDRECPPFSLSNPHPLLSRMPPFRLVRLRLSLPPPPRTPPPDATRCAFTCDGEARGHDDALPSSEGRRDGIPGRWQTFRTGPALDRLCKKEKRPTERTRDRESKGGHSIFEQGG